MKKREGYSLVEMIITIAIIAMFVGLAALGLAYLSQGNSKKLAGHLNSNLTTLRSENMAKNEKSYMHLYCVNDTYYIKINHDTTCVQDENGLEIGTTAIDVSVDSVPLTNGMIHSFTIRKKDGAFEDVNDGTNTYSVPSKIKIVDASGMEQIITIVKDTGKHFIE